MKGKGWGLVIALLLAALPWAALAGGEPLLWERISPRKGAEISVYYLAPDRPDLGEEVTFYCEFSGCKAQEFTYDWQYSGDGEHWTSFGSGRPRRRFALSETTAGKYVRLLVGEK